MLTLLSPDEVGARGDALYESVIRAQVEPEHNGKLLLMDIDSGDYEVDWDDIAAEERLSARRPEGVFYMMRAGAPAAYMIGCLP